MSDALRYEWMRIRTIRSTWWITAIAFVIGAGVSVALVLTAAAGDNLSAGDLDGLSPVILTQLAATGEIPGVVGFVLAIIGIFAWGHEYRHGMVRASLTAISSRPALFVAKFAVVGAWVLLVQLVTMLVAGVFAALLLSDRLTVFDAQTFGVMGWQLLSTLLLTWLAMGFTLLTRSQTFALVAVFVWPFLVETLINTFFLLVPSLRDNQGTLRFLPFSAQKRMVSVFGDVDGPFGDPLSPLGGAVVFALVTAILIGASLVLFRERDA